MQRKTQNLVAYLAWALALLAILMPPAVAAAGIDLLADAQQAVFGLVDDTPEPMTMAAINAATPGWQA